MLMSPEKEPKVDSKSQKQKIILGIIVLIVLGVAWQMLGGKSGGDATITPSPTAPGTRAMGAAPGMNQTPGASTQQVQAQPQEVQTPKTAPIQANVELLRLQQQTQADYIASINKLQMLKLQREIDETKTAIATAELNRMTAEKNIADLITSKENLNGGGEMGPIGGSPAGPMGGSGNPLSNFGAPATTTTTMVIAPHQKEIPLTTYDLMSVAYQGHGWNAILGNGKDFKTVSVGDQLEDGSVVTSITRQGVTLKRDNKSRTLTMQTSL
jgi:hypothetical protein